MPRPFKVEVVSPVAVKVTAVSMFTNKESSVVMPMGIDAFIAARDRWVRGALVQDAFPSLSDDDREFLMTGVTRDEWEAAFKDGPK